MFSSSERALIRLNNEAKKSGNPKKPWVYNKKTRGAINTETGEKISRYKLDKDYGLLKEQGFKSYKEKAVKNIELGVSQSPKIKKQQKEEIEKTLIPHKMPKQKDFFLFPPVSNLADLKKQTEYVKTHPQYKHHAFNIILTGTPLTDKYTELDSELTQYAATGAGITYTGEYIGHIFFDKKREEATRAFSDITKFQLLMRVLHEKKSAPATENKETNRKPFNFGDI